MRRLVVWLGITLSVAALAACSSKPVEQDTAVPDCVFPDAPSVAAPGWICSEPVEGVEVSAVGSAQKSTAGISFMKQMAATAARVEMVQQMKVHVANMVKQYAETTGAGDSETVDRVNTSVTKQITDETLVGSKIYKTRTSPNGTLYVLIGLDPNNAVAVTEAALRTSMGNDQAAWQQFKAQKAQDELAAEIARQRGN